MSVRKRIKSFGYALRGISVLFVTQPNARIHAGAALLVTAAGVYYKLSAGEWAMVVLCIVLVLSMEAVNTAVEQLTDLVSPDYHPLAGSVKDVAAAAVLIAAVGAVIVAAFIFLPKIAVL